MEAKDKIQVALDVDSVQKAIALVKQLAPHVGAFKIGLELINSMLVSLIIPKNEEEAVTNLRLIRELFDLLAGKIFWDGKFKDIPDKVAEAARAVTRLGVQMFSVHCLGGPAMMKKAREAAEEEARLQGIARPLVLGVTLLTSLDYQDLVKMRFMKRIDITIPEEVSAAKKTSRIQRFVYELALLAYESGLDGVTASPQEVQVLRGYGVPRDYLRLPLDFLIVTPSVRPLWAAAGDQKRAMTPGETIKVGADRLVIGRPITQPPVEIGGPVEAAKKIAAEIEAAS